MDLNPQILSHREYGLFFSQFLHILGISKKSLVWFGGTVPRQAWDNKRPKRCFRADHG